MGERKEKGLREIERALKCCEGKPQSVQKKLGGRDTVVP